MATDHQDSSRSLYNRQQPYGWFYHRARLGTDIQLTTLIGLQEALEINEIE